VEVRVALRGDRATIEVRDRGPGIAEADLPRLFARFERAASTRHYGGLGLGLYLTRQIAAAHGGSAFARNAPEGGASFTVELPLDGRAAAGSPALAEQGA
jgi:signal transduction histidine kinase